MVNRVNELGRGPIQRQFFQQYPAEKSNVFPRCRARNMCGKKGYFSQSFASSMFILNLLRFLVPITSYECNHDECLERATRINKSMDTTVDPCKDFFDFACGAAAYTKSDNDEEIDDSKPINRFLVMPGTYTSHLWWIRRSLEQQLNEPYRIDEHRSIGLAKMYWQSCKSTSPEEALTGVRILLKRLGGWPLITENWRENSFTWEKFSKCARLLGFLPRMFIHVGLSDVNRIDKAWSRNDTIELTIERSKYVNTREEIKKTMSQAFDYLEIAKFISDGKEPDIAEIEAALQFAKQIYLLTYSEEMPTIEQKIMTISQLQKTYAFVNWMDYIRSMLTRRQANYLSDRNCVIVDVTYVSQIAKLLERTDKRIQANYGFLSIIDDLTLFIRPQLSLSFTNGQRGIERICFYSVTTIFIKTMEMILVKLAGQSVKKHVDDVQKNIAKEAHKLFGTIPWMDHQTRLQAAKKSERTTFVNLFLNDIFEDSYYDRLELTEPNATLVLFREVNVFLVNRYYLQLGRHRNQYLLQRGENQTMLAIFQSPFSSIEMRVRSNRITNQVYIPVVSTLYERFSGLQVLDFWNYATIGLQIANAIGQQIYQRGSFVDSDGLLQKESWWSKTSQRQFRARKACADVGTIKPLDEMSSTFGLIGAAEIAYQSMFENPKNDLNVMLPGLEFSTRQLFWISAVASECNANMKDRYNTMFAHNTNFSQDFRCPIGSNMNAMEKCTMWIS